MFELIDRATRFDRQGFASHPDQKGTRNMVALNPRLATFTSLQTGHLFTFAVQLLNLPAVATRLLGGRRRILSDVVGDDIIRAVGGYLNPETLPFVVFRKPFDFAAVAWLHFRLAPGQRVHVPLRLPSAGIIHQAMVAQRAVVNLLERLDEEHQVFGRVPGVHQHGIKRQRFVLDDIRQPVLDVVEFGFAIAGPGHRADSQATRTGRCQA